MNPTNVSEKKLVWIIIILALVAVGLGFAIYKQGFLDRFLPQNSATSKSSSNTAAKQASNSKPKRPLPEGLSEEELALMTPPGQTASEAQRNAHYQIGKKLAKEASALQLNKCNGPSPLDMKLVNGQEFDVVNSDTSDHTIIIGEKKFTVKANSTETFKADFGRGNGLYGYICDDLSGVAGFFFVTPKE